MLHKFRFNKYWYLNDKDKFKNYSSSSNEITLFYQLEKYIPDNNNRFTKINLDAYQEEFSSNVNKDKFEGYITISKYSYLFEIKTKVSEKTGFPINTMIKFGIWGGEEYDRNGEKWTMVSE